VNLCYVLDSWPRLSETFVRRELAIAARLHDVRILALERSNETVDDDESRTLEARVTFLGVDFEGARGAGSVSLLHPLRARRALLAARRARVEGTLRRLPALLGAADRLRRWRVDRIHAHFARWATAAAEVLSAYTGAPFGFTAHAYDLFDDPVRFHEKVRAASWVVTCSDFGAANARRLAREAAAKIVTIRHGLDLGRWAPATAPRAPGPCRILAVGRLIPIKGFDVLIDAAALLRQRGVDAALELVGEGEAAPALEAKARTLGLADRVRLVGARRPDEVREAMRTWADVVAVPSRLDRLPNVVAEALACGRPVVATSVGGIAELVTHGETGLLVAPDDAAALADALARLAADPALCVRLGAAGRARVEAVFDADVNVRALLAHIESAANPGPLSRGNSFGTKVLDD